MNENREQTALKAYMHLLASKGVEETKLIQTQYVILRLIPFITPLPLNGRLYREAVDKMLQSIDVMEWAFCIPVIRDFYSFWIGDIKGIAAMNQDRVFGAGGQALQTQTKDAKVVWASLNLATYTEAESKPLRAYELVLRQGGADEVFIEKRKKIAKLLLLSLRAVPHKQANAYRQVIDSNLSLFTTEETKQTYLNVGREFYYFWIADQHSANQELVEIALAA